MYRRSEKNPKRKFSGNCFNLFDEVFPACPLRGTGGIKIVIYIRFVFTKVKRIISLSPVRKPARKEPVDGIGDKGKPAPGSLGHHELGHEADSGADSVAAAHLQEMI